MPTNHLYYVPLEPIKGRYTEQLSRAVTGWNERNWIGANIPYTRIEGPRPTDEVDLGASKVINPVRRCEWGFAQTTQIVKMIMSGEIGDDDVVYFDDFWHPGLEMIAQAKDERGSDVRLFSFCHAQSVDKYDFMHARRWWARSIEEGFGRIYESVFVNNHMLAELLNVAFNKTIDVKVVGHPFSEKEVVDTVPVATTEKENIVVFSSRFDKEKNPHLFMDIAEEVRRLSSIDIHFVLCSGGEIKSDDRSALFRLNTLTSKGIIQPETNLSKPAYYHWLQRAKVQLSTSLQDWVSYCLLEALSFDCYPVYPNYRSFPETFGPFAKNLYPFHPTMERSEVAKDVAWRICNLMDNTRVSLVPKIKSHILGHHNMTWHHMAIHMDLVSKDA